jgi:SAM-dependent methyltransferase
LDVGCGHGDFARLLATVAHQVDALDISQEVIEQARRVAPPPTNVRFMAGDLLDDERLAEGSYDFISALAVLHHLPFAAALDKMRLLLRPGGTLAILGLHRDASVGDFAMSAIAVPVSLTYRLLRGYAQVTAPTLPPTMPLRGIRESASRVLPGAITTRLLFDRHLITWTKPAEE